jgi:hypothetical protein
MTSAYMVEDGRHGHTDAVALLKGIAQDRHHLVEVLFSDRLDHGVLTGEIAINRARGHSGFGHQILHGCLVEPFSNKAAASRRQDMRAPIVAVLLGHLRHQPTVTKNTNVRV